MWNNSNHSTMQNYASETESTLPAWKQGQNCASVMIEQLNRYGDELKIWGVPARIVTFVAIVDEIEIVSTRVNFKFHDETGSLKGLKWLESGIAYECPVKTNSYARVYGSMRSQQDENFILVAGIRPIEHLNELSAHLMEVTHMCLQAESLAVHPPTTNKSFANHNPTASGGVSTHNGAHNDLNNEQNIVRDIISRGDAENGAERNAIKSHVPSHMVSQVDEILDFLCSEGHVYTTISDNYFKLI